MNETETRVEYIDSALKAAGWSIVEGGSIRMEFPINKERLIGMVDVANPTQERNYWKNFQKRDAPKERRKRWWGC